ncbi:hypothetical protein M405DRAFT_876813, partial [Rhizopogon salebrosus TDB-379]
MSDFNLKITAKDMSTVFVRTSAGLQSSCTLYPTINKYTDPFEISLLLAFGDDDGDTLVFELDSRKLWDKPKLAVSSSKYRRNVCLPSSKVYRRETQGAAFYLLTPRRSKKQARNIITLSREDSGIGLAPGRISDSSLEGNLTRDNSDSDLLSSVPYLTPILIPRIMAAIMTTWCDWKDNENEADPMVLCDAKSPSIMNNVGDMLPREGVEFTRNPTEHNSDFTGTQDLPEPFRAFLGALLSILKSFPVGPSEFKPKLEFDTIERRGTPDLEPGDDLEDEGILWQLSIGSHSLPAHFVFNLHGVTQLLEPRKACDNERDRLT